MRIIGGAFKGRHFTPHRGFKGRPTTDFGREGLFNLLRSRVDFEGLRALDLFAGTGAIAFELMSRGAQEVVCVEKDSRSVRSIKDQARAWQWTGLRCIRADVLRLLFKANAQFDLVFADPPFDMEELESLPDRVRKSGFVAAGGLFVLEHGERRDFSEVEGFVETRNYGKVHFSFFEFD
jgi:16S rRNA (guanine(966)-N(2))-methyltransferase RsmD